jgi:hypothetical protein
VLSAAHLIHDILLLQGDRVKHLKIADHAFEYRVGFVLIEITKNIGQLAFSKASGFVAQFPSSSIAA